LPAENAAAPISLAAAAARDPAWTLTPEKSCAKRSSMDSRTRDSSGRPGSASTPRTA
jgi:hypothetical protein